MNFIIGRNYQLKLDGVAEENVFDTYSSVPQGSHIGPLLFNIFVWDMVVEVKQSGVNLHLQFADDTKMLMELCSSDDQITLQKAIDILVDWSNRNRLDLNEKKCHHVSFTRPRSTKTITRYFVESTRIETVAEFKDLGVLFDEHLTFKAHQKSVLQKGNNILYASIRFAREIRYPAITEKIIRAYVLPLYEYGSVIWHNNSITISKDLESTIRKATRYSLQIPFNREHPRYRNYSQRLRELDLNTLENRRIIACIVFIFKSINDTVEHQYNEFIRSCRNVNIRNTRNPRFFSITNEIARLGGPVINAMRLFNEHYDIFSNTQSISGIKEKLKAHFINVQ